MGESGSHNAVDLSEWRALANRVLDALGNADQQSLPKIIGVSGSQGSGKSTFAGVVVEQLQMRGFAAAAVSLDDFYLTHADRQMPWARRCIRFCVRVACRAPMTPIGCVE